MKDLFNWIGSGMAKNMLDENGEIVYLTKCTNYEKIFSLAELLEYFESVVKK